MLRIRDIMLSPDEDKPAVLRRKAAARLGLKPVELCSLNICRRSVDARRRDKLCLNYTVDVTVEDEETVLRRAQGTVFQAEPAAYSLPVPAKTPQTRPVVAGFGPAGMFAALSLAEVGLKPLVLERGQDVDSRTEKVRLFRERGELDPESNVQFGEGGAGTFSDGKLNTGVGGSAVDYVLRRLVSFGAQERIVWDAAPHVGTDVLKVVVRRLRERILSLGGELCFGAKLSGLDVQQGVLRGVRFLRGGAETVIACDTLLLAVGHSARDTLEMLLAAGVAMSPKDFSMGLRIEHIQAELDRSRYGRFAGHPALGPAAYKLAVHLPDGTGVYTFCMCPGGYVVAAASETGGVVTNGMSYSGRAGANANAALLASLPAARFPYAGPLGGVRWQRELERAAFQLGGGRYLAPAQTVGDFLTGVASTGPGRVKPTYQPGVAWCDLHRLLPSAIAEPLAQALPLLNRRLPGFADKEALLTGPETRSSSPVRLPRDERLQSVGMRGLYPCGEGAGWAGGIVSAAVDGLHCAEAYIRSLT